MWARILDGKVEEIINFDPSGKFHSSIVWAACSISEEVGDNWNGGQFSKSPAPTIDPLVTLNAAWLAQTFETSGGHIITVRPPQVNKFDESVYESMIKQIDLGNITEGVVTDVNYIQRSLSRQDLEDALTDGFVQTSANYQTYIDSL